MNQITKPLALVAEEWDPEREAWHFVDSHTLPGDNDLAYVLGVEGAWLASGIVSEHITKRIRKRRGAPHDATAASERLLAGTDAQTWLTAAELLGYTWNREVSLSGYVGPTGYARFKRTGILKGSPFNERKGHFLGAKYLDSIGATRMSAEAMDRLLDAEPELSQRLHDAGDERRYTVVEVTQTLAQALGFVEPLAWLRTLAASRDLRVVVGL